MTIKFASLAAGLGGLLLSARRLFQRSAAARRRRPGRPGRPRGPGGVGMGAAVPGSQQDLAQTAGDRVFFEFDRSDISPEAQQTLQRQAQWLQRYPNVTVTIEGHCDERGTREYNLALGERRANAAGRC